MEYCLIFLLGIVCGAIIANVLRMRETTIGYMDVDAKDPTWVRIRIGETVDNIEQKKYVRLKVNPEAEIPHDGARE